MAAAGNKEMLSSARIEKFISDKEQLISTCKSYQFVSVKSNPEEINFSLEFISGEKKTQFTIHFTPDYPNNTVVTNSENPADLKCYKEPLINIFIDLCNDWCTIHEIPLVNTSLPDTNTSSTQLTTQISEAPSITSSEITEGSDNNCEDDDYIDNYGEDFDFEEDYINSLMHKDIENIEKLYRKTSIETKVHAGINEVDVLLYIDMSFLDIHTASAWGVNTEVPVVLHIHFHSTSEYLDGPEPKLEVYQGFPQGKEKTKFGLGTQIQKVVETFILKQWKITSNYHLEQEYGRVVLPVSNTYSTSTEHRSNAQKLLDMGFDSVAVEQALDLCHQNIEKAVHLLTTGELLDDLEMDGSQSSVEQHIILRDPPVRQDSQGAKAQLTVNESLENIKRPPSLEHGFLAQVMMYTLNRIPSLNEFCVICDERHILETGLLRPCVCTRELCVFAFQTLGVMADAAESVATDADVVDLLIAMCNAAAISSRASVILDPYPSIVDPHNLQTLAMDPANKNFQQIKTVMNAIITGREELLRGKCSYQSLKSVLDGHHILAFPLMQWIVATNRAYIVIIPQAQQLKSMGTKYQFLLISSPPAKELAFQQAKQKHGSTFAFHGSNIENWHSIMRKGLINASGTKYQLHGAAYGNGIYLSPNAGTSFGYSNRHYSTKGTSSSSNDTLAGKVGLICIALCEVVTSKDLRKNHDIWVCPNADHVVTRFFFVYDAPSYSSQATSIHTQDKKFKQEILVAFELANQLKNK